MNLICFINVQISFIGLYLFKHWTHLINLSFLRWMFAPEEQEMAVAMIASHFLNSAVVIGLLILLVDQLTFF